MISAHIFCLLYLGERLQSLKLTLVITVPSETRKSPFSHSVVNMNVIDSQPVHSFFQS